jgi:hypothetical protein
VRAPAIPTRAGQDRREERRKKVHRAGVSATAASAFHVAVKTTRSGCATGPSAMIAGSSSDCFANTRTSRGPRQANAATSR